MSDRFRVDRILVDGVDRTHELKEELVAEKIIDPNWIAKHNLSAKKAYRLLFQFEDQGFGRSLGDSLVEAEGIGAYLNSSEIHLEYMFLPRVE